ncbi:MAG: hypothetical protein D4R57_01445 [Verrucomicrobiales bacterium]|nr:MAG: hypothetical protein D4R57_01445 [Verrucomicrobiales bacterium]
MAFLKSANEEINRLQNGTPKKLVLEYLRDNAVGYANAKPWGDIEAHLDGKGVRMSQTKFQQTILKESRSGDVFIGSNDHGVGRGYFLIKDESDAKIAREFSARRIAAQVANLTNLDRLMKEEFPQAV